MLRQKIFIDASPICVGFANRGVGNQIYSILKTLFLEKKYDVHVGIIGTENDFKALFSAQAQGFPSHIYLHSLASQPKIIWKIAKPIFYSQHYVPLLRKIRPDFCLFFIPDFGFPDDIPSIVFIPDVTPYKSGVYSQKNFIANKIKQLNYNWSLNKLKKLNKVFTISEYVKKDLGDLGFSSEKIEVIPLAVTLNFIEAYSQAQQSNKLDNSLERRTLNMYNLHRPYIFYIGGLEQNKNVNKLVDSFALLADKHPDLSLVIGGKEFRVGWDNKTTPLNERAYQLYEYVRKLKLQHRVNFCGFIDQKHLPIIYQNADCFVHLSKSEGFGLTVLEPQMVGVPVVAANATSYPEVLADSALLVNPDDSTEVAENIEKVLDTPANLGFRKEIIEKGRVNIKRFSWDKTTKKILKAIQEMPQSRKTKAGLPKPNDKSNANIETSRREPKKALILAAYFWPFFGGMENVAYEDAFMLSKMGFEVHVITSDRKQEKVVVKKFEEIERDGGKIRVHRLHRKGTNYYAFRLKGLFSAIQQIKPDVVHVNGFGFLPFDLAIFRLKYFSKIKVGVYLNTPHGPFMAKSEKGIRLIIKKTWTFAQKLYLNKLYDAVFSVNNQQIDWINKDYGISAKKVFIKPPVMPQPKEKSVLNNKGKKKYIQIASVTRLASYKGLEDIIAMFGEINSAVHTKLVIAGADDDFTKDAKTLVRNSVRKEDIKLEVDISDARRDEILAESDIFILASEWEAFGIVIAEAMAYYNAIISTKTEGGQFLVTSGENGFLYEYKDIKKLVELVNDLIINSVKLKEMQSANISTLEKYKYEKIFAIYQEIILNRN